MQAPFQPLFSTANTTTTPVTLVSVPASPRLPGAVGSALARGALVLTASARAARALQRAHAEDASLTGARSWRAPAIRDWSGWLLSLYEEVSIRRPMPLMLSPLQEQHLWSEIQHAALQTQGALVVSPERLARLAQSAYALLDTYTAHSSRRASWAAAHQDAEHFLTWAELFDRRCAALNVLPRGSLEATLRSHVAALYAARQLPPELLLVGFDRLTPAQRQLLQSLEHAGTVVQHAPTSTPATRQTLLPAADEREEMQACALWVRAHLAQDPTCRIGILVPELAGCRAELDRVFRRVLLPEASCGLGQASGSSGLLTPYEFSLGSPLAGVPLVASACLLLRWLTGPLPAAELTSLLTGGFLAATEAESRELAETDRRLREAGLLSTEISLATLRRGAANHSGRQPLLPPAFTQRLHAADLWIQATRRGTRDRTWAEWSEAAIEQLTLFGWPGYRELGSATYQAQQRWLALIEEMAQLDVSATPIPWSAFVRQLLSHAQNTLFTTESHSAPVQILGLAESAGLPFDAIWLLQMTEDRWPPRGRLHPLLAPGVQHDAGMPHARPELDLELASDQLRRVVASEVVCSYAQQSATLATRPSPLLAVIFSALPYSEATVPAALLGSACELVSEAELPLPPAWPAGRVAGGTEVLKRQAACGFQSFAAKRLGATPLEEESWGLDARERATLLHRTLEELWSPSPDISATNAPDLNAQPDRLYSQADLVQAINENRVEVLLDAAIGRSFARELYAAAGDPWRTTYLALEQRRLRNRLLWWLAAEQDRAPFQVLAVEQRLADIRIPTAPEAGLGPLRLNLRADRIDQVAGGKLILDYKTSATIRPGLWSGNRPDEPQLPIYALYGGIPDVAGIAFAQIRVGKGKTRLCGLADDPEAQLDSPSTKAGGQLTPATRDEWSHALQSLATDFATGSAPVNPKRGNQTCKLCGLHGLCRIRSKRAAGSAAPEIDSDIAADIDSGTDSGSGTEAYG